jgi:hypothetical protein
MKKLLVVVCLSVLLSPAVAKASMEIGLGARYMGVGFDIYADQYYDLSPINSISANNKVEMNGRLGVKMYPLAIYIGLNQTQGGISVSDIDEDPAGADTVNRSYSFLSFKPELALRYYLTERACAPFLTVSFWKGFGSAQASFEYYWMTTEEEERLAEMMENLIGKALSSLIGFSIGFGTEYKVNDCVSFDGTLGYFWEKTTPAHTIEWTEPAGDYKTQTEESISKGGIFGQLMVNFTFLK